MYMPQKTDEKEMTGQPSDMSGEGSMYMDTTENVIYLAGGCFWGMEQLMQSIPGVIDTESGYANGTCEADADYKTACKGETGCGWTAFTKPIEEPAVVELEDLSHGRRRTEVRSRAGDSHLGHVFTGDPESPKWRALLV